MIIPGSRCRLGVTMETLVAIHQPISAREGYAGGLGEGGRGRGDEGRRQGGKAVKKLPAFRFHVLFVAAASLCATLPASRCVCCAFETNKIS